MIELDPRLKTPLYEQLYAALADEIRRGDRAPGTPLPGRRTMAAQQGVSVNTVDTAYQMLAAEGLAEPRPAAVFTCRKPTACCIPARRARPRRLLCLPPRSLWANPPRCLTFPPAVWTRRCSRRAAGGASKRSCSTSGRSFCSAARCRATLTCGARSRTTSRIIAVWSVRRSKLWWVRALSICWVAWRTCSVIARRPSRTQATPARGRFWATVACLVRWWTLTGTVCRFRRSRRAGKSLCYLTPRRHFPTRVTMPATRRAQLLAWAAEKPGRCTPEDDYDFRVPALTTRPLPCLQGMAGADGPVVAPDHLLQSLAPGIRIACMVLPQSLLRRYRQDFAAPTPTRSAGLSSRHFASLWRAGILPATWPGCALPTSAAWLKLFAAALRAALPGVELDGVHSGLHFLLTLPPSRE